MELFHMVQFFVIISTFSRIYVASFSYQTGRFPFLMPNVTPYRVSLSLFIFLYFLVPFYLYFVFPRKNVDEPF